MTEIEKQSLYQKLAVEVEQNLISYISRGDDSIYLDKDGFMELLVKFITGLCCIPDGAVIHPQRLSVQEEMR